MKIAVSYVRWSSGRQSLGDSKERQLSKTKEFCAEHGLVLDLQMVDDGKSAFKGKHIAQGGSLKKFLDDLQAGLIPKCVLIVESLDRLSRQTVPEAMEQFLGILNHGVDIVTLIDGQWYSRKSLGDNSMPLMMSLVYMMRAHEESKTKAFRIAEMWKRKQLRAVENHIPMSGIVPGWLEYDPHTRTIKPMPDRVKKLKLIFWLWCRGFSRQRIAQLFNRHSVPTWGRKKRRTSGWQHSYVDKILKSRAVLGELVPFFARHQEEGSLTNVRKPAAEVIKGYYPQVISEVLFYKAQARRTGARGPVGHKVSNLFQGLLKDGDFPPYTMCYRDHGTGSRWQYVVSDHRRVFPKEPIFSWNYPNLERFLLNYLSDLDWSMLTTSSSQEVKSLKDKLDSLEGKIKHLSTELKSLVELATLTKGIQELAAKIQATEAERAELRRQVSEIRSVIKSKETFSAVDGQKLVKELAGKPGFDSRQRLKLAIRQHIERIDMYRKPPQGLKYASGCCIRLTFSNGAERWLLRSSRLGVFRLDGTMPEGPQVVQDEMGGLVQDERIYQLKPIRADAKRGHKIHMSAQEETPLGTEVAAWEKKQAVKPPKMLTRDILEEAREKTKARSAKDQRGR